MLTLTTCIIMANLRRTKLKAKRCGCNVKAVDKCVSVEEVYKLMNQQSNTPKGVPEDGISK
ncbi:MAG: hypothetical protein GON13_03780 [Nanoarchaeota archaeon]|nr:hypothetical protein [Nanoarchaeota archaeon]